VCHDLEGHWTWCVRCKVPATQQEAEQEEDEGEYDNKRRIWPVLRFDVASTRGASVYSQSSAGCNCRLNTQHSHYLCQHATARPPTPITAHHTACKLGHKGHTGQLYQLMKITPLVLINVKCMKSPHHQVASVCLSVYSSFWEVFSKLLSPNFTSIM
jgi:hypothetical protein